MLLRFRGALRAVRAAPRTPAALALRLASALLAACGSRSSLPLGTIDPAGAGGAGGSGPASASATASSASAASSASSASTTASTGAGGSGGAGGADACELAAASPVLGLAAGDNLSQRKPVLTPSSDDGKLVTVVASWSVVEGPAFPEELRHTTFQPWTVWPADGTIEPSYLADFEGGISFAAAPAPQSHFGLLFLRPDGLFVTLGMVAHTGAIAPALAIAEDADAALFLSRGQAKHLLGYRDTTPLGYARVAIGFAQETPGGTIAYEGPFGVGCATSGPAADAAAIGDGWLLAIANGVPLASTACDAAPKEIGPAARIQVGQVTPDGALAPALDMEGNVPVAQLEIVPRSDGAWLVWTRATGGGASPIQAARLDGAGQIVVGPFDVSDSGDVPLTGWLAADRLGDRLVVASVNDPAGNPAEIVVRVIDSSGETVGRGVLGPGPLMPGALDVLGSADGESGVVVAWAEPGPPDRVRLARLACPTPLP